MSVRTRALHAIARLAVRHRPPLSAKAIIDRAARFLPPFRDIDEARRASASLGASGTCLTRALTIASRLPGAEVVIGASAPSQFAAHAWVELSGEPITPRDADVARRAGRGESVEIVRLR